MQTQNRHPRRLHYLLAAHLVLALRYALASFLSAFFSPLVKQWDLDGATAGIIFAAYPAGMAITSAVGPIVVQHLGTRNAITIGLLATAVTTLAFGLVPDVLANTEDYRAAFILTYSLNGLLGAISETSAIILVSSLFRDRLGAVMASVNTVAGIGCMAGPLLGGVLYDLPERPEDAFRLPFVVCAAFALLLAAPLHLVMPNERPASDKPPSAAALRAILSPSSALGFGSVLLSGLVVASLDPTLSYRLSAHPFTMSASLVSLLFTFSSIVFVAINVPLGCVVDRVPQLAPSAALRVYKALTAIGFFALAAAFVLLAPLPLPLPPGVGSGVAESFNTLPAVVGAMGLKGVGSALSAVAVYPDLVAHIPADDDLALATVSGLWNAAYSLGWALGPLVGGYLYEALSVVDLCVGAAARTERCVSMQMGLDGGSIIGNASDWELGTDEAPSVAPGADEVSMRCSCVWTAHNGFDGMSGIMAAASLAYGLLLLLASALGVGGSPGRRSALVDEGGEGRQWKELAEPEPDGVASVEMPDDQISVD